MINFTYIVENFIEWAVTPFTNVFGNMFWASIFSAVIAISWIATKNLAVTLGAILLTFGIFGTTNAFLTTPEYSLFFGIVAVASIAGLMLELFITRGNN